MMVSTSFPSYFCSQTICKWANCRSFQGARDALFPMYLQPCMVFRIRLMSPLPEAIPVPHTLLHIEVVGSFVMDRAAKAVIFESKVWIHGSSWRNISKSQLKAAISVWPQLVIQVPSMWGTEPALTIKRTACRRCQHCKLSIMFSSVCISGAQRTTEFALLLIPLSFQVYRSPSLLRKKGHPLPSKYRRIISIRSATRNHASLPQMGCVLFGQRA